MPPAKAEEVLSLTNLAIPAAIAVAAFAIAARIPQIGAALSSRGTFATTSLAVASAVALTALAGFAGAAQLTATWATAAIVDPNTTRADLEPLSEGRL